MIRIQFFRFFLLSILSCLFISFARSQTQPNILLIMADDMGYGDLGAANNPYLKTPELDRLKAQSVSFEYFYVSSVCAPTRASLLTGRYAQRTGVTSVTNGFEIMNPDEYTLAELLKPAGYRTGIFGKWHLGEYYPTLPNPQGFDEFWGFHTGHTDDYYDPELLHNTEPTPTQGYITDVLTDKAIAFIDEDSTRPFFCYLPYNVPHTPLQIDSSWYKPYHNKGLTERTVRIYGMIAQMDQQIGKLVQHLSDRQLLEETIIILLSDNGPASGWRIPQAEMRYNVGLRDQKFSIYEGGIRTQCFWMWKGKWQPRNITEDFAAHIDVVPTMLDLLNLSPNSQFPLDGVSIRPVLENKPFPNSNRIYFHNYALETIRTFSPHPGGIARKNKWKMVNDTALYHLKDDPGETQNLASVYPDTLRMLQQAYNKWWEDIQDTSLLAVPPIPVGYPQSPVTLLQPHHAQATGNIRFWGQRGLLGEKFGTHPQGVDGDWASEWTQKGDQLEWLIQPQQSGLYELGIFARGEGSYPFVITLDKKSMLDELITTHERTNWEYHKMGTLRLDQGEYHLQLSLNADVDTSNVSIRSLSCIKIDE